MLSKVHPYLLLTLTTLFWAGNFVIGRAMKSSIPPFSLAFWRWTLAFIMLLPFSIACLRRDWPVLRQNWRWLTLFGILGVACFNTFVYIGLHSTTATNALIINSAIPILIVLLSRLLAGTVVSGRQAFGIALSLSGVLTIISRASLDVILTLKINSGDAWILLAVFCWAFYTFLLRHRPAALHPLSFLTSIVAIGLIPLSMLYAWELSRGDYFDLDPANITCLLYVGLFPSVLAFIFWNRSVSIVGANRAGLFLYLMPVFGTVLSVIFLGETFHLFQLAGIGLIFTGIWLTTAPSAG
ncbi:MAG TPA: DMT family transporter [Desulfuromonadales bacterium]|nr:DMT family transporter [Desulfuromonadales bacterium]